jgi:hypothetical protein
LHARLSSWARVHIGARLFIFAGLQKPLADVCAKSGSA